MNKTIILNAGHNNAADCGAAAHGTTEAKEAMKIRDKLAVLLKQNFDVVIVPDELDLRQSIVWVNNQYKKIDDGLAFSIHLNAGGGHGAETFYLAHNDPSKNIAKTIVDKYCEITGFRNRGAKADTTTRHGAVGLGWIRRTNPWSCLMECCFIDTLEDIQKLQSDYERAAWGLYVGICAVYKIEPAGSKAEAKEITEEVPVVKRDKQLTAPEIKAQIAAIKIKLKELLEQLNELQE